MGNEIFDFLDINDNTLLSEFKKDDLQYLLDLLKSYYISYRNRLNFSFDYTFGVELEFDKCSLENMKEKIVEQNLDEYYNIVSDDSVKNGGEIVSSVLIDSVDTWNDLKKIGLVLKRNALATASCGTHVHVGFHLIKNEEQFMNLLKLWASYENVLFRFYYGEYINLRKCFYCSTERVRKDFYSVVVHYGTNAYYIMIRKLLYLAFGHKQCLYFGKSKVAGEYAKNNTMELRLPNPTFNPIILQNYVNVFLSLIKYAISDNFNNKIIAQNFYNLDNMDSNYDLIYLEQALELADLIFENNLDKINFLRQYIKDGKVKERGQPLTKSRRFTKIVR